MLKLVNSSVSEMNKRKQNLGITLIELIVVIAIVAIMAGAGGMGLSLMIGAESKRAASNMNVNLNEIKTATMTRAGETAVLRYIEADDSSKLHGVDKSGFYLVKSISTIMNTDAIKEDYSDPEYTFVGNKRVNIYVNDSSLIDVGGTTGLQFEYDRKTGTFKKASIVTMSSNGYDALVSGTSDVTLSKISFQSGLRTYVIEFDAVTGKHSFG